MLSALSKTVFLFAQAALITALLLALMISMVQFAAEAPPPTTRIKLPNILLPEREVVARVAQKPQKPRVDETPPPRVPRPDFAAAQVNTGVVALPGIINPGLDLELGVDWQQTDGEYLPIVKIAPIYPRRALSRGIEGYVILEYVVTRLGTVRDVVVVEAEPRDIFNRAAVKSAMHYKYKPRVVDGEAVDVSGVRTKIEFKITG